MLNAANYSADEQSRDGRCVKIRALKPDDKAAMLAAVSRVSGQSMYRRFFGAKRGFSENEQAFYLNVDFIGQVALVAAVGQRNGESIVGGGRYVVVRPAVAEIAFTVIDEFQGKGIGSTLLRHLIVVAREAGLKQLIADVLPENVAMLKVFENSGLSITTRRDRGVVHVQLRLC